MCQSLQALIHARLEETFAGLSSHWQPQFEEPIKEYSYRINGVELYDVHSCNFGGALERKTAQS